MAAFLGAGAIADSEVAVPILSPDHFRGLLADVRASSLVLRGAGHSAGPIAQSRGGLVLLSRTKRGSISLENDRVRADARLSWLAVERFLRKRGRSIPVLPDYLHLTLGGTLSVGGIGYRSPGFGAQIHNVLSLRLHTPDGDSFDCSRTGNSGLFFACLGGLGLYGWISEIELATVPKEEFTLTGVTRFSGLEGLLAAIHRLTNPGPGHGQLAFAATINGSQHTLEIGVRVESPASEGMGAAMELLATAGTASRRVSRNHAEDVHLQRKFWLKKSPGCRFFWADWILDFAGMEALLAFSAKEISVSALGAHLRMINILMIKRPSESELFLLQPFRAGEPGFDFSIGFYFNAPEADGPGKALACEALRLLGEKSVALGGRPYLYGFNPGDAWKRALEATPGFARAMAIKRRIDPAGRFGWDGLFPPQ